MEKLLADKIALVTGGASGIGRACAFSLVEEGARVAVCDRNEEAGTSVVDEITSSGGDAMFCAMDVAVVDSIAEGSFEHAPGINDHARIENARVARRRASEPDNGAPISATPPGR